MTLDELDLADLCRGAAFLGTGGGGDPYVGRLMAQAAMREFRPVEIIPLDSLPDDALVIPTAMMGAPTVLVKNCRPATRRSARSAAWSSISAGARRRPCQSRSAASTRRSRLVVAARLGLPVVDVRWHGPRIPRTADGDVFRLRRVRHAMVITNENGDQTLIETRDMRLWSGSRAASPSPWAAAPISPSTR